MKIEDAAVFKTGTKGADNCKSTVNMMKHKKMKRAR